MAKFRAGGWGGTRILRVIHGRDPRATIFTGSSNNTIGGTAVGAGNRITFNGLGGVWINSGMGNAILSNSIFSNIGLAIDLSPPFGVNTNDNCDSDTGPNNLQHFPIITPRLRIRTRPRFGHFERPCEYAIQNRVLLKRLLRSVRQWAGPNLPRLYECNLLPIFASYLISPPF